MSAPYDYVPNFVADPMSAFDRLWAELPWERRDDAPRREVWMNDFAADYTYGRDAGKRTYASRPWHPLALELRDALTLVTGDKLEACFVNGYEGPRDHLGWHSDDGEELDGTRPIAIISLGSARNIRFRLKGAKGQDAIETEVLEPGSLLWMRPGMQLTHEHSIPKHGANCGARVSLTYRGLLRRTSATAPV